MKQQYRFPNSFIPYQSNQPPLLLSLKNRPRTKHFEQSTYLTKYRVVRPRLDAQTQRQSMMGDFCGGIWKNIKLPFTKQTGTRRKVKFCPCEKSEDGWCKLMLTWVEQFYQWKKDKKFVQVYQYYNRKGSISSAKKVQVLSNKKSLGNSLSNNGYTQTVQHHQEEQLLNIQSQLKKVLRNLRLDDDALSQQTYRMLTRVLLSYRKHANYYNKAQKLIPTNFDNCIYVWLAMGVFYHIGEQIEPSKITFQIKNKQSSPSPYKSNMSSFQYLQESMLFWSLDILMNTLQDVTIESLKRHADKIVTLLDEYFPQEYYKMEKYGVDLHKIILLWLEQMMCGYMNLQNLGFYVSSIIKFGWNFVYKVILSYLQKRLDYIERSAINIKDDIIEALINSDEEWPMIFCNATTFRFDKDSSSPK